MEGAVDTSRTYGDGLDVARDGRLDIRVAKGSVLRMTSRGLDIDPLALGEKNRAQMNHIADAATGATTADLVLKVNELLAELRRTKRVRGGF